MSARAQFFLSGKEKSNQIKCLNKQHIHTHLSRGGNGTCYLSINLSMIQSICQAVCQLVNQSINKSINLNLSNPKHHLPGNLSISLSSLFIFLSSATYYCPPVLSVFWVYTSFSSCWLHRAHGYDLHPLNLLSLSLSSLPHSFCPLSVSPPGVALWGSRWMAGVNSQWQVSKSMCYGPGLWGCGGVRSVPCPGASLSLSRLSSGVWAAAALSCTPHSVVYILSPYSNVSFWRQFVTDLGYSLSSFFFFKTNQIA